MDHKRIQLKAMNEDDLQESLLDTMDILYGTVYAEKDRRGALQDIVDIMTEQLERSLKETP